VTYVQDPLPGMEDESRFYPETIHGFLDIVGQQTTVCCGRTMFELPRGDRITLDIDRVTCGLV
jgi:hypothetical protein